MIEEEQNIKFWTCLVINGLAHQGFPFDDSSSPKLCQYIEQVLASSRAQNVLNRTGPYTAIKPPAGWESEVAYRGFRWFSTKGYQSLAIRHDDYPEQDIISMDRGLPATVVSQFMAEYSRCRTLEQHLQDRAWWTFVSEPYS